MMRILPDTGTWALASAALPWVMATTLSLSAPGGAVLRPEAVSGWTSYVTAAEQRMAGERESGRGFLGQDFAPDAAARHRALIAGRVLIDELTAVNEEGETPEVPGAMVHHWRGAIFVPDLTAHELVQALARGLPGSGQDDVLESRVLSRQADGQRVFLRVQRTKFVTVVYDTIHDVRFATPAPGRAWSASTAIRIAEIEDAGTAGERALPPGRDRGFLWRWNAYWRYQDVPGGVLVECESLSLSRSIPAVVRFLAAPLIRQTARESMERTLVTLRGRFAGSPAVGPAEAGSSR